MKLIDESDFARFIDSIFMSPKCKGRCQLITSWIWLKEEEEGLRQRHYFHHKGAWEEREKEGERENKREILK